jgi:hypothetical protein
MTLIFNSTKTRILHGLQLSLCRTHLIIWHNFFLFFLISVTKCAEICHWTDVSVVIWLIGLMDYSSNRITPEDNCIRRPNVFQEIYSITDKWDLFKYRASRKMSNPIQFPDYIKLHKHLTWHKGLCVPNRLSWEQFVTLQLTTGGNRVPYIYNLLMRIRGGIQNIPDWCRHLMQQLW